VSDEREDFAMKLLQIQLQADALVQALPPGDALRLRAEHIASTVRQLKARLDVAAPSIIPGAKPKRA
jgi:hypothetical protein